MVSSSAPTELFRFSRRHHHEHPYLWLWLASGSVLAHLVLIIVLRPWMVQTAIAPVSSSNSEVTSIQLIDAASLPSEPAASSPSAQATASAAEVEKTAIAKSAPAPTAPQTVILPEQPAKAPVSDPSAIAKPNPQTQERPVTAPVQPPILSPFPKAPEPDPNLNPNSPLPGQGQPIPAAPPAPTPAPAPAASPLPVAPPAAASPTVDPSMVPLGEDLSSGERIEAEQAPSPLPSVSPADPVPPLPTNPTPAPTQPERLPDVPTTYDTSQGLNTASNPPLGSIPVQPEVAPSEVVASVSATPTPITDTSRDILDTYATPRQTQEMFLLSDAQSACSLADPAAWQMMGQPVSAQIIVDTSGQAEVIPGTQQGTGNADYDQFAICLLEQHWQFEPATMDGQPVPSDNLVVEVTLNRV